MGGFGAFPSTPLYCDILAFTMTELEKDQNQKNPSPNEKESSNDSINSSEKPVANGSGDAAPSDDADDDSRKLFVGGLHWETTENDLKEYFSQWGRVTQCIIKLDRYTGNSRGFGFVTLESEECVSKVLAVHEHKLRNKKIDPKKAKPSREPLKKIFVGGIDPEVKEEKIKEYFSQFGKVESLDLPFDNTKGKRKSYVFVSFATEAAARKAIAKERQEIFGRLCDVRAAVSREQANRQKGTYFILIAVVLKQWYSWLEPAFGFANNPYGDFAYQGFDPFGLGYYSLDLYNPAAAGAYAPGAFPPAFNPNVYRPSGPPIGAYGKPSPIPVGSGVGTPSAGRALGNRAMNQISNHHSNQSVGLGANLHLNQSNSVPIGNGHYSASSGQQNSDISGTGPGAGSTTSMVAAAAAAVADYSSAQQQQQQGVATA
ncbi:unnamed protein product [Protopolystoma xenopodis]|uniref:RRM domain-containing protein n=1 Tax=Protopolystoma xenopodis TaxID=117903 RepID=A0A3S5A1N2_9PLAT|nr:unnamed protein product [Protopolystoma xenopodis]